MEFQLDDEMKSAIANAKNIDDMEFIVSSVQFTYLYAVHCRGEATKQQWVPIGSEKFGGPFFFYNNEHAELFILEMKAEKQRRLQ